MTDDTTSKFDNRLKTAKTVVKFVVKRSVSATVVTMVHQNTTAYTVPQKAQLYVGAYLMGSMVADHALKKADEMLDDTVKFVKSLKEDKDDATKITDL